MALSKWSINIVQQGGSVVFTPDLPGAQPGQPLGVLINDHITWYNMTDNPQVLTGTDPNLNCQIPAGQVSDPIYQAPATAGTITYQVQTGEQGSIVVTTS